MVRSVLVTSGDYSDLCPSRAPGKHALSIAAGAWGAHGVTRSAKWTVRRACCSCGGLDRCVRIPNRTHCIVQRERLSQGLLFLLYLRSNDVTCDAWLARHGG